MCLLLYLQGKKYLFIDDGDDNHGLTYDSM